MASYEIQQIDINMLKLKFNFVWIKLELANIYEYIDDKLTFNSNFKPIANISGDLKGGSYSCDSTSDIRRNLDIDFVIKNDSYNIGADKKIWINKFIIAYLGVSNFSVENIKYYPLGIYLMNNASYSYSLSDKTLSLSCVDLVALLNGDRNGIIPGMQSMKIEAVPEICSATILSVDDSNKIITINIQSDDYKPLTDVQGDMSPYYYCNVGFNLKSYSLLPVKKTYDNYSVFVSINNFAPYQLKDLTKSGKSVTFDMIDIGQDYVCTFDGNSSEDYCFVFYGKPNTISGAMTKIIEQFSPFKYLIESIGSDVTNADGSNTTYIPYDLEFSTGTNQWDVVTKLRVVLSEEIFSPLVISEKPTYDFTSVKNVTEVWGKCHETDRYDDSPKVTIDTTNKKVIIDLSLTLYSCNADGKHNDPYEYSTSELLGFTMPSVDSSKMNVAINNSYPIYLRVNYESDTSNNFTPLSEILLIDDYTNKNNTTLDKLINGLGYCVQPKYVDDKSWYAIFCGEFQVHAVCMLVDKEPSKEQKAQDKIDYNCQQISYIYHEDKVTTYSQQGSPVNKYVQEDCPYTIEKCGKILQVLSGNDYEQIYTTDLARQRAEYEAWKAGRLTDSITVETRLIPFLDVNMKITYKSLRTGQVDTYIVDKISHSFDTFTTTIEMHKFYTTYPFIINTERGGKDELSNM